MIENNIKNYRADIDGLRAIAILAVVGFHYYPHWIEGSNYVQGGFIGVDIFFVISGYLITSIISKEFKSGQFTFINFYAKRIKRLFPALLLLISTLLILSWLTLLPDEFISLSKQSLAGIVFSSNILSWLDTGYFDDAADTKPLLNLWSLGIEEQFYIFWPSLFYLIYKFKIKVNTLIIILFITSFILNIYLSSKFPEFNFFSPITRAWELIAGSFIATSLALDKFSHSNNKLTKDIFSLLGIILIIYGVTSISSKNLYPSYFALIPIIGTFLIIISGQDALINSKILSNKILIYIGLISYPLYLWHWPLLVLYKVISSSDSVSLLTRLWLLILSFILATITYEIIEKKIRWSNKKIVKLIFIYSITIISILLFIIIGFIKPLHNSNDIDKILSSKTDWVYPGNQFNSYFKDGLRYYTSGTSEFNTIYIGDSNLEQYASRVNYLLKNKNEKLNSATFIGNQRHCQTLLLILDSKNIEPNCLNAYNQIVELASNKSVTNIVIAAQWINYSKLLNETDLISNSLVETFKDKNIYIILTMPTGEELDPNSMFKGSRLSSLQIVPSNEFDLLKFKNITSVNHQNIYKISKNINAIIINPIDYLCENNICPVTDLSGRPLYKDSKHMTSTYSRESAIFIDSTLFNKF
jgi:peptidoglycan/LPS O-acetylase OafA/YrhL